MEKLAYVVIGGAIGVVLTVALQASSTPEHSNVADGQVAAEMGMSDVSVTGAMHRHPPRDISPDKPVPSVTHLAFPDAMDGYNVQIIPRNFTFTPADIDPLIENMIGRGEADQLAGLARGLRDALGG